MPIQVLLVNRQEIFRAGLRILLQREGFEVAGDTSNSQEAIEIARRTHPDVAVLDVSVPPLDGLKTAEEIRQQSPKTRSIILTEQEEPSHLCEAMSHGVAGYIQKAEPVECLIQAILEVLSGGIYWRALPSPGGARKLHPEPLSPRESQVFQLVAQGNRMKEIASILGLSVKTVEAHRTSIMAKLGIHEPAGLVRYAIRRGMIKP